MRIFRGLAYANEWMGKLNAKIIKCLIHLYYESMKAYWLMYWQENYKNKDGVFMKDSTNIRKILEMHPHKKNEGPMVVVVDKTSTSSLIDGGG